MTTLRLNKKRTRAKAQARTSWAKKISLNLITHNNEEIVGRCLRSVIEHVDEVVVVDTASTDGTRAAILEVAPGAIILDFDHETDPDAFMLDAEETWSGRIPGPFTGGHLLANFAAARQRALEASSGDYVLWIDTDDVVEKGDALVDVIADLEATRCHAASFNYDYNVRADGAVRMRFFTPRLVRRSVAPRWAGVAHELLSFKGPSRSYNAPNIRHLHGDVSTKPGPRHRGLKILTRWADDVEAGRTVEDARMLFYLGREERSLLPALATKHLQRYLDLPASCEEKSVAAVMIGQIAEGEARYADAKEAFWRAQMEAPGNPDGFFGEARVAYFERDLDACITASERGLDIARRRLAGAFTFGQDLEEQSWRPHVFYSFALLSKGRAVEGLASAEAGLAHHPTDIHLLGNKAFAERTLALEVVKIAQVRGDDATAERTDATSRKMTINLWTGPAWEPWSPESIERGIGGSETAAVHMAAGLAARGHTVRVFGMAKGSWGGVEYVPHSELEQQPWKWPCDVLIASRQEGALNLGVPTKVSILWVHDVTCGVGPEAEANVKKADLVMVLSRWHAEVIRTTYPSLDAEKIWITRNGIDVDRFSKEPRKVGRRAIYASSPDRGLEKLLGLWPKIKERVPEAELHVYYGFDTWKTMAIFRSDVSSLVEAARIEGLLEAARPLGVVHHGRTGQEELALAYSQARVWAYPTAFTETSCISAMEAQAAACVPVTSAVAALSETVKTGHLIRHPTSDPRYDDVFLERIVRCLSDDDWTAEIGRRARKQALADFPWDGVVSSWETKLLSEVERRGKVEAPTTGTTPARGRSPKLRVAVILGRMGARVHGLLDGRRPFDGEGGLITGTVGGFLGISWGLAERGVQVDAFCDAKEPVVDSAALGGVNVYPIAHHTPDDTYDAYLSINEPDVLRIAPASKLRIVAQWLNDFTYCKPGFDDHVDAYACPSMTHLLQLAKTTNVAREKLVEVPLSINPELYDRAAERRPLSVAYASSPDRGLHNLLEIWPEVRRRVPGAELRVYYRVMPWVEDILDDLGQRGSIMWKRAVAVKETFEKMGRDGKNGLWLVGPLPPRKMLDELSRTEVLAYPCDPVRFTEGFSVTVLDGCAAGCVPICSDADALGELWWGAAHVVRGKPSERKEEWTHAIVKALTDKSFAAEVRATATMRSRELTRGRVAARWEEVLRTRIAMKSGIS